MAVGMRNRKTCIGAAALIGAGVLGLLAAVVNPFGRAMAERSPSTYIESADTMELSGLQKRFEAIATRVAPGVVAISAAATRDESEEMSRTDQITGPKLEAALDRTTRTVGTGFVIDPNGYIVTNEHVVGDAEQIWVTTDDKRIYPAMIVGSDPRSDLAVLKIPATHMQAVKFAAPGGISRGQWTITLGNPYGLAASGQLAMSVGVVSALDRSLPKLSTKENRLYNNLIQTTAQINPGNSGGPLFNLDGDVVGINSAVILPQKQTNGIGFAMPVTDAMLQSIGRLKDGQEIIYGYLGVTVVSPTAHERKKSGIDGNCGVRVESIEPQTPASAALQPDDIVLSFAGQEIVGTDQFIGLVGRSPTDVPSKIKLVRAGKTVETTITVGRRPLPSVAINRGNQRLHWRGMLIGPIPAEAKRLEAGLLVLKVDKSRPDAKAVAEGSLLTKVAGKPVRTLIELQQIINDTPAEKCSLDFAPGGAVVTAE